MITILEQHFLENVPRLLRDIHEMQKKNNEKLTEISELLKKQNSKT